MNNLLLIVNFDYIALFITLWAFAVPGMIISRLLFKKRFGKVSLTTSIVYYLASGFFLGTLLLILMLTFLVGAVKYIP
jgi:hypothetical protein